MRHEHRNGSFAIRLGNRDGVLVRFCGEWAKPLSVWRYQGFWHAVCRSCYQPVQPGWFPGQPQALNAALRHCGECHIKGIKGGPLWTD